MQALTEKGEDWHVEMWKIKKLIAKLDNAQGNGTSVVSLYIAPTRNIQEARSKLSEECARAA
jgi:peptide chain release factor subunit 1